MIRPPEAPLLRQICWAAGSKETGRGAEAGVWACLASLGSLAHACFLLGTAREKRNWGKRWFSACLFLGGAAADKQGRPPAQGEGAAPGSSAQPAATTAKPSTQHFLEKHPQLPCRPRAQFAHTYGDRHIPPCSCTQLGAGGSCLGDRSSPRPGAQDRAGGHSGHSW